MLETGKFALKVPGVRGKNGEVSCQKIPAADRLGNHLREDGKDGFL